MFAISTGKRVFKLDVPAKVTGVIPVSRSRTKLEWQRSVIQAGHELWLLDT